MNERKTHEQFQIDLESSVFEKKRFILVALVTFLWVALGILGVIFRSHFYYLSIYFLSLTGFVGAYIISESMRPSLSPSVFKAGRRHSKREIAIYVVTALWAGLGAACIMNDLDLLEAAAYFGALTPYVSTFLIGSAYTPDIPRSIRERNIRNGGGFYGGFEQDTYHNDQQNTGRPYPNNPYPSGDFNQQYYSSTEDTLNP